MPLAMYDELAASCRQHNMDGCCWYSSRQDLCRANEQVDLGYRIVANHKELTIIGGKADAMVLRRECWQSLHGFLTPFFPKLRVV
jgi:hypothetical protein